MPFGRGAASVVEFFGISFNEFFAVRLVELVGVTSVSDLGLCCAASVVDSNFDDIELT